MKYLFPILLVLLLAGCGDNPLGTSTRMRMLTDAQVAVARAEADAKIAVAEAESRTIVAKHSLWAGTLPPALLIVGAVVVIALVVNWKGRHTLAHIERTPVVSVAPHAALPARPSLRKLHQLAQAQGMTIQVRGDVAYLMDGNEVRGQRQLAG